jgi:Domain of unknown function (DUF5666)
MRGLAVFRWFVAAMVAAAIALASAQCRADSNAQTQGAAQNAAAKQIGTIKAISGNSITLTTDSGANFEIQVEGGTRMVRVAPGQADLKGATAIHLQDLQVGDRILVRGEPSQDAKSIAAAVIIAMKGSDVEAKQEQEREDWQKRGIGGIVSAVDPASGAITISSMAAGPKKSIAVHTTSATVFRRYAPDSVKFDDAKPSSISDIKAGDQLRARGNRNADNTEFTAEEIVSGAFRNIAGTITSVDPGTNTVVVKDLATKQNVAVKISADSQVRRLPERAAQMIAIRLKGGGGNGAAGNGNAGGNEQNPAAGRSGASGGQGVGSPSSGGGRPGGFAGNRPGGAPDFQQMLNRMPEVGVSDLQKGDAVMIVSTEGATGGKVTAITLLAGVEPILEASPTATLPPWGLGAPGGGGEDAGGSPQ